MRAGGGEVSLQVLSLVAGIRSRPGHRSSLAKALHAAAAQLERRAAPAAQNVLLVVLNAVSADNPPELAQAR